MAGKGKVSNELVAVGCAAVLAVYAAGYWRTRDAARRIETQAQERRVPVPERAAAIAPAPAAIEVAAADEQPHGATVGVAPAPAAVDLPRDELSAPQVSSPVEDTSSSAVAAVPAPPTPVSAGSPQAPAEPTVESAIADTEVVGAIGPAMPGAQAPDVPAAALAGWRDGSYSGWGSSRHGDILAQVVIRNGRIVESSIVSCETRWPCDVISGIIDQPVQRQSAEVDRVSRATASADAYYFALVQALERAIPEPAGETATPP